MASTAISGEPINEAQNPTPSDGEGAQTDRETPTGPGREWSDEGWREYFLQWAEGSVPRGVGPGDWDAPRQELADWATELAAGEKRLRQAAREGDLGAIGVTVEGLPGGRRKRYAVWRAMKAAAKHGRTEALKRLDALGLRPAEHWGEKTDDEALLALSGANRHWAAVDWLLGRGCSWPKGAAVSVAKAGDLPLLQELASRGCPMCSFSQTYSESLAVWGAAEAAARHGHIPVLEWLWGIAEASVRSRWVAAAAASSGKWRVLEWLEARGAPMGTSTTAMAAGSGSLETLQWLRAPPRVCPWDENTCVMAANNGHKAVLQWAVDEGCPFGLETYSAAVDYEYDAHRAAEGAGDTSPAPTALGGAGVGDGAPEGADPVRWVLGTRPSPSEMSDWLESRGCPTSGWAHYGAYKGETAIRIARARWHLFGDNGADSALAAIDPQC